MYRADETAGADDLPQGNTAYRRLLEEIRQGALPPGARLRETELAERLGISRSGKRSASSKPMVWWPIFRVRVPRSGFWTIVK